MDWGSYLGLFGLGSVVTAIVQWMIKRSDERKNLRFTEKREAYFGLLNAYRKIAVDPTHENTMEYALWRLRCKLVASKGVLHAIEIFSSAAPRSEEMKNAEEALIKCIRNDLKILD